MTFFDYHLNIKEESNMLTNAYPCIDVVVCF